MQNTLQYISSLISICSKYNAAYSPVQRVMTIKAETHCTHSVTGLLL